MGFLDTLFSPGEIEEQGKVESQTNFPQWYNRLNQANLLRATETAFEPYKAYQGPRQALSGPAQDAARLGIGVDELTRAFHAEAGAEIRE